MYQKKEEKNSAKKISPHLSQLNVAMAHRNYFRWNNLWILKLATYIYKDWRSLFWCKLAFFIGKDWQMFIFYVVCRHKTKFYWFVMKIKKFMLPIWWYNLEVYFFLGINIWGSSTLRSEWVKTSLYEQSGTGHFTPGMNIHVHVL